MSRIQTEESLNTAPLGPPEYASPEKARPEDQFPGEKQTRAGDNDTIIASPLEGVRDPHASAGLAVIEQHHVIPQSGTRKITTKWEYWLYIIYYIGGQGVGIGNYGGAIQQALLYEQFPGGTVNWGGRDIPLNTMILDLNGILFAVQLFVLLGVGPYADYGNWRPWLLIIFTVILWGCQLGFTGLTTGAQWQAANALFVLGNLALNLSNTFYWAAFPGLVRDLPQVIKSEQEVVEGTRRPEDHAQLDMLERSRIYNLVNIVGSAGNLALLGIATGAAYAIGTATTPELNRGYQVLSGMFGAMTVVTTIPWFLVEQHRPGQKLPAGTGWLWVGPKQIWQAAKHCWHLRQAALYLLAFFVLQETSGTSGTVVGILQNTNISFNTMQFSGLTLVAYLSGGSGTILVNYVQQKYKFTVKQMLMYGATMTMMPNLWGMIGNWTDKIGFKHEWEFWLWQAWNFQQAAWGSYAITMISEVCPAPKMYLFMALFNTVGKTSQFIGPFISGAIISDAGSTSACFYFLLPLGLVGLALLACVNTEKAIIDNAKFLETEAREVYNEEPVYEKNVPIVHDI